MGIPEAEAKVRVTIGWYPYNPRRYGKPWIAVVKAWPVGARPELSFGSYIGDGRGGELEIMAAPDDIIRYGQRDGRAASNDAHVNEWAMVEPDGSIRDVTQVEARRLYGQAKQPARTSVSVSTAQ